jgi:hypothetical protein
MKTVAQLIREDADKLVETPEAAEPTIVIKTITKDMRFIFIDGEKVGVLHHSSHLRQVGFSKWRKVPLWAGEFTFRGEKVLVGATEKTSELLPKVARLVRSVIARQSSQNE